MFPIAVIELYFFLPLRQNIIFYILIIVMFVPFCVVSLYIFYVRGGEE